MTSTVNVVPTASSCDRLSGNSFSAGWVSFMAMRKPVFKIQPMRNDRHQEDDAADEGGAQEGHQPPLPLLLPLAHPPSPIPRKPQPSRSPRNSPPRR